MNNDKTEETAAPAQDVDETFEQMVADVLQNVRRGNIHDAFVIMFDYVREHK